MAQGLSAVETSVEADKLGVWAARQIFRRAGDSVYFPTFLLEKAKREAVQAVGAFLYMSWGALEKAEEGEHRERLFLERVDEVYGQRLELPLPQFRTQEQHVLHAFATAVRRYPIPRGYFADFVAGRRRDVGTRR